MIAFDAGAVETVSWTWIWQLPAGKGKILFMDCSSDFPAYALDVKPSWCASSEPLPKMPSGT
jgi:hypothetical protein